MAFRHPLNSFTISQGFGGNAAYYRQFGQSGHNGIDYATAHGQPVFAADEGTVSYEGWGQNHSWMGSPAGICVLIHHGGSYAGYAHLSSTIVNKGQKVSKGQLIGYVGSTGAATGPHLHFEMLPLSPNFNNGFAGRIDVTPYIEGTKNATQAEIKQAYLDILERAADAGALSHYVNYPLSFVRSDLMASAEKRALDARKAEAARLAALKAAEDAKTKAVADAAAKAAAEAKAEADRIAAEEANARLKAEQKAQDYLVIAKENSTKLDAIFNLLQTILTKLTSVFK